MDQVMPWCSTAVVMLSTPFLFLAAWTLVHIGWYSHVLTDSHFFMINAWWLIANYDQMLQLGWWLMTLIVPEYRWWTGLGCCLMAENQKGAVHIQLVPPTDTWQPCSGQNIVVPNTTHRFAGRESCLWANSSIFSSGWLLMGHCW